MSSLLHSLPCHSPSLSEKKRKEFIKILPQWVYFDYSSSSSSSSVSSSSSLKSYLSQLKVFPKQNKNIFFRQYYLSWGENTLSGFWLCEDIKKPPFREVHHCRVFREAILFGAIFIKRFHALNHPSVFMCSIFNLASRVWEASQPSPEWCGDGYRTGDRPSKPALGKPIEEAAENSLILGPRTEAHQGRLCKCGKESQLGPVSPQ